MIVLAIGSGVGASDKYDDAARVIESFADGAQYGTNPPEYYTTQR